MGHSQAEKAVSRERILAEAARRIRRDGLESLSVGALMAGVGLTHGGFYGHFDSREALVAEALERALAEGAAKSKAARPRFSAIVRGYLSRTHRDARDSGCAMAALAGDVARAGEGPRERMGAHIEAFIDKIAASLGGDEDRAILAVSAMIGGLTLSRAVADPARSDAILKAVRDQLEALASAPTI